MISGATEGIHQSAGSERIGSFGNSKAVLRFTAPAEVKGVALLIVNHPDRASDQWMWTPSIGRERRIALQDRSTRFFGTDFSFEDLEERDVDQYEYKLTRRRGDRRRAVLEASRPPSQERRRSTRYSCIWIRKDQLRHRAIGELHQGPAGAQHAPIATSKTYRASGPRGSSK